MVVVALDLALVVFPDDFGCLLGVFVATDWRGESSAAAAADEDTEADPPRVRVDRRVAAVALLLMVAAFAITS